MNDVTTLLLSAVFAAAVAVGATVMIERFGGRLGGLLATLPTTIVPASVGIYASSVDVQSFREAMFCTPAGMLLNALFLYLWRVVPARLPPWPLGRRLAAMTALSLGAWLVAAAAVVLVLGWLRGAHIPLAPVGIGVALTMAALGAWSCRDAPPAPRGHNRVGVLTLLARGILAGAAIAGAVWLSSVGGALAAGIASVFPAIFITTMVSLWWSQGEAVQVGAVGPMMLGATSVTAFALIAAWSIPALGPWAGCAVAWVAAVSLVTIPAWWALQRPGRGKATVR